MADITDPSTQELTEEFYFVEVYKDGLYLQHVPKKYRTPTICTASVQQNPEALKYIPAEEQDKSYCTYALRANGLCLKYVHNQTEYAIQIAVRQNCEALALAKWVSPETLKIALGEPQTWNWKTKGVNEIYKAIFTKPTRPYSVEPSLESILERFNAVSSSIILFHSKAYKEHIPEKFWIHRIQNFLYAKPENMQSFSCEPKDIVLKELYIIDQRNELTANIAITAYEKGYLCQENLIRGCKKIFKDRVFEICLGLQGLGLPALVTLFIVDEDELGLFYPMYRKWNIITTVKHFCLQK